MSGEMLKSAPGHDPIIIEAYFAVRPARVFQAWTDPDQVKQWFGQAPNTLHSAVIDLRPGGVWRFLESKTAEMSIGFEGEYLDIEPGERLVFTWSKVITRASGTRKATPKSRVEVTFAPNGDGTDVRLVHFAVPDEPNRRGFGAGWSFALGTMRTLLASA